ncbi:DUF6612 family protein [Psychrobacillus sp.]|uniref:DUF6612 family protein n=1 Tax=Psychrobacillus sp. TaxID=1871623 RepID=UPI0028BE90E1|nr:DUF6612 family protein [Psychrobacillus sp.]
MKKWMSMLAVGALSLSLAACNQTASPTDNTKITETSNLTLQEVYDKSIKASEELKSVKATIDMKQKMSMVDQGIDADISSLMDMEYVIEPMQIYQKGKTTMHAMTGDGEDQVMDMESYITKDSFYMSEGDQWMKLPQDLLGELQNSAEQSNPSDQLKQIESFLEDFTFKQDNDHYILSLEASGEKFTELVQSQLDDMMQNIMDSGQEANIEMDIKSVKYLIHIDKKTFNSSKVDMVMDMSMVIDGEEMMLYQDVKTNFSHFNEIKEIVIPQDVIDSALEI